MKNKDTIILTHNNCPVCSKQLTAANKSNANFNGYKICKSCIKIINKYRGGEKSGKITLNYLQKIVKEATEEYDFSDNIKNEYGSLLDDFYLLDSKTKKTILLENKYESIITKHYQLMEQIDMLYSTAINLPNIDNEATKKCIQLCLEDIDLANDIKKYESEKQRIGKYKEPLPRYPSFEILTKLYDKLGYINEAIIICKKAIDMKFYRDSSKGGIPGRLARLLKKKDKINN